MADLWQYHVPLSVLHKICPCPQEIKTVTQHDFIAPRLTGARFDEHSIPLDILKDMSVFQDMVFDVAKWLYLNDNPERTRSPRGFTQGVSLHLVKIDEGSAIPAIVLSISSSLANNPAEEYLAYYQQARTAIVETINSANNADQVPDGLPPSILSYFDRLGRNLKDDEAIEFSRSAQLPPARLTPTVRQRLLDASNADTYTNEVLLLGQIPEIDLEKKTFTLLQLNSRRLIGPLEPVHFDSIKHAFDNFDSTGQKIVISGIGIYSKNGKLTQIESVDEFITLDPRDIGARLEEIAALRSGWHEGQGHAFPRARLKWLWSVLDTTYPDTLPLPYIYPTPNGELSLEWSENGHEISLELDINNLTGYLHILSIANDEENEQDCNLETEQQWADLIEQLRELLVSEV